MGVQWSSLAVLIKSISRIVDFFRGDSSRATLTRGSLGTIVVRGASFPLGLIASVLLARYLGITQLGVYSEALAWGSVVAILGTAGLDRFAVREMSGHSATGSWSSLNGLVRGLPRIAFVSGVTAAVVAFGLLLMVRRSSNSEEIRTFAIAIGMAPVMSLAILRQGMLQGLGQVALSRLPEDFLRPGLFIVMLIGIFGVIGLDADSEKAMAIQAVALVLAFVAGMWLLRRAHPADLAGSDPGALPERLIRSAIPLGLFAAVSILMEQVDVILLGIISDTDQVAIYATAFKIATIVSLADFAVSNAYQPMIGALMAKGEVEKVKRLAPRAALVALALAVPFAVMIAFFSGPILSMFGPGFEAGRTTLQVLCFAFVVNQCFGQNGALLMMSRNTTPLLFSTAVALALNICLNIFFGSRFGAEGAAIAWLITVVAWNVMLGQQVWRIFGFSPSPFALLRSTKG